MRKTIQTKKDLNSFLKYEAEKYKVSKIKLPLFCISERSFLWKHNYLLRTAEYHINANHKIRGILWRALLRRYQNKHKIHIPLNSFGKGLRIMHLGPILVNGKVEAGDDVALHINTAIVAGGVSNLVPKIGNGVVIGVGATIIGGITLEDNVAVGANSLVNKDVLEENIAVAGVPAKKISNNGRLEWNKSD